MKDPTRQVYSRDLDVVLEENNMHQGKSYLDQVLEPNCFLRNGKASSSNGNINNNNNNDSFTSTNISHLNVTSTSSSLPQRRARAGTMPSMMSFDSPLLRTATHNHAAAAAATAAGLNHTLTTSTSSSTITPRQLPPPPPPAPVGGGRHRSGSLNLPPPSLSFDTTSSLFWSSNSGHTTPTPPSPATEQLLQGDSDFSIARTMRSLGLVEDGSTTITTTTANGNMNGEGTSATEAPILDEEELINQSRASLLASASNTTTRNRSYSVNATIRYDPPPLTLPSHLHSNHLHPQQQHHFTLRPRGNTVSKTSFNTTPTANSLASYNHYHHLLDTFSSLPSPPQQQQQQQQRTRSISFGQSSSPPFGLARPQLIHGAYGSSTSDSASSSASSNSSLWQMHRPLTPVIGEEEHMSLGDSELLANMYEPTTTQQQHDLATFKSHQEETLLADSYMHPSHSTPTSMRFATPNNNVPTTRSLWIGNIDASITVDVLTQTFAPYGPIESVRLLMEKECAFVNYFYVDHAVRAKEDLLGPLGGRIGHCIVRVGYGRTDTTNEHLPPPPPVPSPPPVTTISSSQQQQQQQDQITHQATRALWLGNIPTGTSSTQLEKAFGSYGTIESIRILSHKTCAFINFDCPASASAAQDAFHQMDLPGFDAVRIGFAKVPPPPSSSPVPSTPNKSTGQQKKQHSPSSSTRLLPSEASASSTSQLDDLWTCMVSLGCSPKDKVLLQDLGNSTTTYAESIPSVPEFGANRQIDANRLREIRKKLDGTTHKTVCDNYATECLGEIAELCSDYIGNTVIQRFFDKCSESMKLTMLERIAPHLAAIGVHKNGTWAAQKILDTLKTPQQCALVRQYVKTYVPALLLDQFGNYVVQCCLRLGADENQFVFDAMVENCGVISQGRFGARAMRGILESQHTSRPQQAMMAACMIQQTPTLATHANGSLLVAWLMDTYADQDEPVVLRALALQLIPHLTSLAIHKLGSQILLKLINQTVDKEAQEIVLSRLVTDATLTALLLNNDTTTNNNTQPRTIQFFQKVLYSSHISQAEHHVLCARARSILLKDPNTLTIPAAAAFLDELNGIIKE
ncbi:hypothetical protein BC941DRAFT_439730 [Chlamydoabsidia padenii]|nr:hypothetical protein BC941DRAFT_439730 [Chlamydoabsidia padenii]